MKATGKGSIASILAIGLHFARIILMIAFVGLSLGVLLGGLVLIFDLGGVFDNAKIDGDFEIDGGDIVEILHYFITIGVMLYVVNRLLELLKTIRFGSPFVKENAVRFRRVGLALLFGEVAKVFLNILAMTADAEVDINLHLMTWVAIAAVFVLAEVFHEGARMKEDQDLTV